MKIREHLNNNTQEYVAEVYEHDNKVVVKKHPVIYRAVDIESFEFDCLLKYELWLDNQLWVKSRKHISRFKNVPNWG